MYYSMNDMKEQLTNSGIMMSNGEFIASDIMVEHNVLANEIRYSYKNESGERWGTVGLGSCATAMFDNGNRINGILTNKPDPANNLYLFWTNN